MDAVTTLPGDRYYYHFEEIDGSSPENDIQGCDENRSLPCLEKYGEQQSAKQRTFDWIMGVFLPMICFYFDPIVFRHDDGIMSNYKVPAYALAFLAILAHAAWLLWGERLGHLRAIVAIVLSMASVGAMFVGIILFPFSLFGIFFYFVGLLGFTPLFSAFVYWRAAKQALGDAS